MTKILRYVLSLVKTVVLGVAIEGDSIVVRVRPHRREQLRCPVCGRRCDCHDHEPTRRWRAMEWQPFSGQFSQRLMPANLNSTGLM
jgi:hypothetical protein